MGWVVNVTPRPLYPRERPGAHCVGGWVGPRAGLNGCEKSRPHRHSIPGPSSPQVSSTVGNRSCVCIDLRRFLVYFLEKEHITVRGEC